jgi:LysM repeat protein
MNHPAITKQTVKIQYRWSWRRFGKNFSILVLALTAALMLNSAVRAINEHSESQTTIIKITSGDTLWSIARKINPQADPRLIIDELREQNQLVSSSLHVGQILKIPN